MSVDIFLKLKLPLFSISVCKDEIKIVSPPESSAGAAVAVNLLDSPAAADPVVSIILPVERIGLNIKTAPVDPHLKAAIADGQYNKCCRDERYA